MSTSSDNMMELIRQQQPAGKTAPPEPAPSEPSMSDSSTGPMAAPMSTPEPKMGNREGALVNISMAMNLIEQALPALGSTSPEGQKVLNAIKTLTSIIGEKKGSTKELQNSEILQMLQSLPQVGGATPEGMAMGNGGMPGAGAPPPPPPMSPPAAPPAAPAGGAPAAPTPPQM